MRRSLYNKRLAHSTAVLLLSGFLMISAPPVLAGPQCESLFAQDPISFEIQRELGEIRGQLFGANLSSPSADSLVGRYVSETGAAIRVVRTAKVQGGTELGPERLVIAVSESSLESFSKHFSGVNFMSVLGHANVLFRGKVYRYGGGSGDFRLPTLHTSLPALLMKKSEAERLSQYLNLTADPRFPGWYNALKQPWKLDGYSATGGYNCCTHWIGNIPVGDRLVDTYSFPSRSDSVADARSQPLRPYVPPEGQEILKEIWKVPGHQQLADVIGQQEANLRGEFASPGWVIQTLIGPTSNERVPLIFWITRDHREPIPESPEFVFERPW